MLSVELRTISFYDKFYRLACDPLFTIEIDVFYKDLDRLVEETKEKNNGSPVVSIANFIEFFNQIEPWSSKFNKDSHGKMLIEKLLYIDRSVLSESTKNHALVIDGRVDIFNFKVLAFLLCRG